MTLSTYLLYLAAVALLVLSPGPTMLMCVTNAINHGPRAALLSATGSVTAALAVMLLSVLGLGALLAASEAAFTLLKTIGALYLVWLGIKTFRSKSLPMAERVDDPSAAPGARQSFYLQGLMVGGSNPKAILFFASLFPQFLNAAAPLWPQLLVLALTFAAFELTVLTLCTVGVARFAATLRSARAVRGINRVCGGLFALLGGLLLLARRPGVAP